MSGASEHWDAVKAQAADWVVREQESFSRTERETFEAWLTADTRHVYAYDAAVAASGDLALLTDVPEARVLLGTPTWRERAIALLGRLPPVHWLALRPQRRLAAGTVLAALAIFMLNAPTRAPVYETQTAELRAVTLADGSIVTLSGNSRLETKFTRGERRVALTRGDAFFAVTKDPSRPFLVTAGDTMVRVVGTKFDVKQSAAEVQVAVVEGVVEVGDRSSPSTAQKITVGQQITAARHGNKMEFRVSELSPPPTAARSLRLDYNGAKLRDIIADANRYYAPGVELSSDNLGDLLVTTSFRSTQVDKMVDSLVDILPVEVAHNVDGRIVIRPRN